jgi:hypothetical protein
MGKSCLLTTWVAGYRRVPEPPASTIPLRLGDDASFIVVTPQEFLAACVKRPAAMVASVVKK